MVSTVGNILLVDIVVDFVVWMVVAMVVVGSGLACLGAGVAERSRSQGGIACEVVGGASLGSQV